MIQLPTRALPRALVAAILGVLAAPLGGFAPSAASAQETHHPSEATERAHAVLHDADGRAVATVELVQTAYYGVHLRVRATGLPEGEHAFHIHETGRCDAPDFTSAGGHYGPVGHDHGHLYPTGKHSGDLPNLHVPAGGHLEIEMLARDVTLRERGSTLFDDDGSAFVIHEGADDYRSQPSGAAGSRLACGVIRPGASGR